MTPEQEKGIMQAFDAYCKTVLRNKARNLHKELTKQNHYEIPIEDRPPEMEQSMQRFAAMVQKNDEIQRQQRPDSSYDQSRESHYGQVVKRLAQTHSSSIHP